MAIYRSDQAQFTFAAESAPGGAPEIASSSAFVSLSSPALTVAANPGDRYITVNAALFAGIDPDVTNKQFLAIGTDSKTYNSSTNPLPSDVEIRRAVLKVGTAQVYLDVPLAFPHQATAVVQVVNETANDANATIANSEAGSMTAGGNANDKLITWVPGVYDTVETPDVAEAFEPRYMLGQNTYRNAYQMFKGQQTYAGSVGGMVLLNGHPLRFPIGNVLSIPASGATSNFANLTNASGTKGSTRLKLTTSGSVAMNSGDIIAIGYDATAGRTNNTEIRQVVLGGGGSLSNNAIVKLNYPLFNTHTNATIKKVTHASTVVYTHHLYEKVKLDTVAWNVNVKDDAGANAFQRRYFGGLIGSMTITAEEGGLVTCGWDTATFLGMTHSIQDGPRSTGSLRRFAMMHDIAKDEIGIPVTSGTGTTLPALPSTEPYYFSEGNIKMFGQTIARVRNFSINVSNGEEARYYVGKRDPDNRGPFEILEGQRTYSMSATVALPSSSDFTGTTAHDLFRELMSSGEYDAAQSSSATGQVGFNIELTFDRGGSSNDQIKILIPDDYSGSAENTGAEAGGAQQGAFIQTAPIPIDGANPMEQTAAIIFRSLKIEIKDNQPFYP